MRPPYGVQVHVCEHLNLTVRDTLAFLSHIISSSAILELIQIQE